MKILSESELRSMCIQNDTKIFNVPENSLLTPTAKEYLKERGITPIFSDSPDKNENLMTVVKSSKHGNKAHYVDYFTGKFLFEKPENMTHLHDNILVPKNHPRIFFRGKIDTLIAEIMKTQIIAKKEDNETVINQLEEIKGFVQEILSAEVNEKEINDFILLGYSNSELRFVTHHLKDNFGFEHTIPTYKNGELCVQLNLLRTIVRETELYAVDAFTKDNICTRQDIVISLNRLSSAVYIIYCQNIHH